MEMRRGASVQRTQVLRLMASKAWASAQDYKDLRKKIGTQKDVAERLNVHKWTVGKRERGIIGVTKESMLALRMLAMEDMYDLTGLFE